MNRRNIRGKEAQHTVQTFGYLIRKAVSSCLLFVLLTLPLAPTFANEIPVGETDQNITTVSETESTSTQEEEVFVEEQATEEDVILNEEVLPEDGDVTEEVTEPTLEDSIDSDTTEPSSDVDPEGEESTTAPEVVPEEESGDTEETVSEEVIEDNFESDDNSAEDEENDQGESENVEEVVSEEVLPEEHTVVVSSVTNDDNRYSFSKNECTVVGDGSYYCANTSEVPQVKNTNRIFAATDRQGDKEIFVEHDGEIAPLTDNEVDDDSPYYDDAEEAVVWHRLIEGRYQIMLYTFDSKEETQLTHDSYNNMEPSMHEDTVVWQAWVGNNWEIMLLEDDVLTQLTENTEPDIAPSVNGDYVVWQAQEQGVWYAKVYDRSTDTIETIENAEGLSIENARFVLVYDTKHENGDIETQGYDLKNKRIIPLAATPAPTPEELPEPDETGEKRALIQNASQIKPKADDDAQGGGPVGDGPEPIPPTGNVSDLVVGTTTDSDNAQDPVQATSTEHIPELIIGSATTTPQIPTHIEDLVIEPMSSSTDPQEGVAEEV